MKAGLLLSVFSLIICTGTAQAVPQTINDNFIGGRPNYTAGPGTSVPANYLNYVRDTYRNADVIGNPNSFNIESMTVDFTGTNTLSVVINSSFFDNI
ncbi:MAG TPA: hypothetical protein PLP17_10570, partial [Oligoflexia bacterium]|nr:hypothetical protein [Oligoflexia bacterium]